MNPQHLRDDLKQELFVILCEMPDSKIEALHTNNQLRYYVTRIVLNMIASSTSPFHKKYRQFTLDSTVGDSKANLLLEESEYHSKDSRSFVIKFCKDLSSEFIDDVEQKEIEHTKLIDEVNRVLDSMPDYDRNLFLDYVEKGSAGKMIKEMDRLTGAHIPKRSILATVKRVKETIKTQMK